jgi:hypothetical protein
VAKAPAGFTIDRDCELKAVGEEKAAVPTSAIPLGDEVSGEIKAHLAAGKLPTKLALTWNDRISFVLNEKLEIKRLAFLDLLKEEAEKSAERADEQFDADFALMTGELSRFLPDLLAALGGEQAEAAAHGRRQQHAAVGSLSTACPCGSGRPYAACCGRLHGGEPAATAEELMRSRYSAYVLGLEAYLLATWHASTRPAALESGR